MWLDLREEVDVQFAMLRRHAEAFAPLREKVTRVAPEFTDIAALGTMLHGFYTGIENVLKRVAVHCDGGLQGGEEWHQRLLASMTEETARRPAVLSGELASLLKF